jgi:hypothetical protein
VRYLEAPVVGEGGGGDVVRGEHLGDLPRLEGVVERVDAEVELL